MTPLPPALLALLAAALTALTAPPAPTAPTAVPTEAPAAEATLDMSPESFDDRYRGCSGAMAAALPALNRSEQRGLFAEAWASAAAEWRARAASASSPALPRGPVPEPRRGPAGLHRAAAAAPGLQPRRAAARRLRPPFPLQGAALPAHLGAGGAQGGRRRRCHRAFRGLRGLRFRARRGDRVRLGGFASASRRNESARAFGTDTFFQVRGDWGILGNICGFLVICGVEFWSGL
ncbi:hypothetical protein DUI87_00078 [Hirundo rustica rustica]|uniref:NAD(P)(+)--arginine ADP-ribosyltransferase n=1 Tax=Hirundo rustica rustica TaxID=333673 RepID=A0A3M0LBN0_HIRRU|nr:hypothetical protein DUI87_00078 [Hirundo rustica rustica]